MSRYITKSHVSWQRAAMLNIVARGPNPGFSKRVRDYLKTHGPRTAGEVAAGTGLTPKQAQSALRNFAVSLGAGVWRLPDEQE